MSEPKSNEWITKSSIGAATDLAAVFRGPQNAISFQRIWHKSLPEGALFKEINITSFKDNTVQILVNTFDSKVIEEMNTLGLLMPNENSIRGSESEFPRITSIVNFIRDNDPTLSNSMKNELSYIISNLSSRLFLATAIEKAWIINSGLNTTEKSLDASHAGSVTESSETMPADSYRRYHTDSALAILFSDIYIERSKDNTFRIKLTTLDPSIKDEMIKAGIITKEEAEKQSGTVIQTSGTEKDFARLVAILEYVKENDPGLPSFVKKDLTKVTNVIRALTEARTPKVDNLAGRLQVAQNLLERKNTIEQKEAFESELSKREKHLALKAINKMLSLSMSVSRKKRLNKKRIRNEYPDKPWLDIPKSEKLSEILRLSSQSEVKKLLGIIHRYHKLNKTEKRNLPARIRLLDEITENCIRLSASKLLSESPKMLQELKILEIAARGKSEYLFNLSERALDTYSSITHHFGGMTSKGLLLRPQLRIYSDQLEQSIPNFDPCYRSKDALNKLFREWESERHLSKKTNFPSFYLWLEDQDKLTEHIEVEKHITDKHLVRDPFARIFRLREAKIEDDMIKKSDGNLWDGDFIYAISEGGKLYLAKEEEIGNHPYIIGDAQPVLCAGHIKIRDGKINYIDNSSGHYKPTAYHFSQAIELLKSHRSFTEDAEASIVYGTEIGAQNRKSKVNSFDIDSIQEMYQIGDKWFSAKQIASAYYEDQSKPKSPKPK